VGEEVERGKVETESIDDLREFLREYFKSRNVEVYLFGSRARGDNSEFSDVDLAVVAKESELSSAVSYPPLRKGSPTAGR